MMDRPLCKFKALSRGVTLGSLGIIWNLSKNSNHQEVLKDGSADSVKAGSMAVKVQHSASK